MKKFAQKEKFIELRAKGLSYDNISKQISASKSTLIKWNTEFRKEISNLQYMEIQSVSEEYMVSLKTRIEVISKKIRSIYNTLEVCEVWCLPLRDLLLLKDKLEKQYESEIEKIKFYPEKSNKADKIYPNLLESVNIYIAGE